MLLARLRESRPLPLDDVDVENLQLTVALGECWTDESSCKMRYYATIGIMFFISFANHFGRIGSVLLQIRCIDIQDKVILMAWRNPEPSPINPIYTVKFIYCDVTLYQDNGKIKS